jgi:hypothetical protein
VIRFVTTRRNRTPIDVYLRAEGRALAGTLAPMTYDELFAAREPAGGTFCFADLELLSAAERERAARIGERGARLLNHPTRSLVREDLLRALHAKGINRFQVSRPGETPSRFPVFLRGRDHGGSRSPLLRSQAELDAALCGAPADTLVVGFLDTADGAGIYRKYGAFVVGDRILPRHLFFSRHWVVKDWDLLDEGKLAEEIRYLEENPHEAQLKEIFRVAGIEYGRMDYSMLDGRVQAWEINTNPVILGIGPSVSRLPAGGLGRLVAPLVARVPALASLRVAVARRLRRSAPRPRAAVHAAFARSIEAAWRAVASPEAPPLPVSYGARSLRTDTLRHRWNSSATSGT